MRFSLHRFALLGVALSAVTAAGALASAFVGAAGAVGPAIVLAWATALLLASLIGLSGARPRGDRPAAAAPTWIAAFAVLLLVGGGLSVALTIGVAEPGAPLWGGLPTGAAVLVYVVGILPAFIVPALYAWGFDGTTLGPEDLERLRDRVPDSAEDR